MAVGLPAPVGAGAATDCAPDGECVPVTEDPEIRQIAAQVLIRYGRDLAGRPPKTPALRDAHAKAHGCVVARLTVATDLPEPLRQGLFAVPADYPAVVRFSNGAALPADDAAGDGRGMAIKLMGIAGAPEGQDFLMINHPVFFVRDAADYTALTRAIAEDRTDDFFTAHPAEAAIAAATAQPVNDVLDQRYFSQVPYRLGAGFVKFAAFPVTCDGTAQPATQPSAGQPAASGADFLAARLYARLDTGPACFDFALQPRTDPATEPLEDATAAWRGPFHPVARLHIEPHQTASAAAQATCEALSFSPWHSLPEHAPVGGINRVRGLIYPMISDLRHRLNETRHERSDP